MSRELEHIIQALGRFARNVAEQDNKFHDTVEERDQLLQQLSTATSRIVELESQLSASLKASEAMRKAMEMAQEESRRWHDQCNALVQALQAYSSSPPKSHARNNRSSINADVAGRSSNRASSSQIAAKVEDSDEDRSTASRLDANLLGDINDPRRKSFSAPRTKKTSHYLDEYDNDLDYQMQSESEDELDGIGPSTKPRPSKRSHTIGSSKSHHINEGTGAKKRRVTSTGTGANKMKRT